MSRVMFGMASAPFCAVRAMIQCALDHEKNFPEAASIIIKKDFYMDDCISGASTKEEVLRIFEQVKEVLGKGGFELRKF